nr:MAG TPA: hypothetical protein [Caudoviricetes sp.]
MYKYHIASFVNLFFYKHYIKHKLSAFYELFFFY